jgi:hypothetical protein
MNDQIKPRTEAPVMGTMVRVTLVFDPSDPEHATMFGLAPPSAVVQAMRSSIARIELGTRRLPVCGEDWVDELGEEPDG